MAREFYTRIRKYYERVAQVLRGDAQAASVFPNSTDIGQARERIYARFLEQHAPSKCNVFLGGFLFHEDGTESKQLDVIVTTDTAPRFNLHNEDGSGKSFSPVEGTLGVASIKSTLDKKELHDALAGIASVPPMQPLEDRVSFTFEIPNYDEWPYKIVYANDGIGGETLLSHLNEYYLQNPGIPVTRRPNLIHVAGKYAIFRAMPNMKTKSVLGGPELKSEPGTFRLTTRDSDLQAILWAVHSLQENAVASTEILFKYYNIFNHILETT
ncbi:DUF6602 domain-containing protein [Symmachiella dynata]|uniref:DUF6602 domain-containing protein n=1 Tax=Symmachiella dynata TaxID=2527995 RepID=UPI0030EDC22F